MENLLFDGCKDDSVSFAIFSASWAKHSLLLSTFDFSTSGSFDGKRKGWSSSLVMRACDDLSKDSPSKPVEPQEGEISLQMIAAPVTEGDLDANISDTATVCRCYGIE